MGVNRGRKWNIPANIDPPGERCITIRIPDDDEWERMLNSAIYNELGMWIAYARDEGKNGTKVAQRWREALRTWRDDICPVEPQPDGEDIEEMSQFRIDCECNIYVKCCDGTEKQILTGDQVKALIGGQPGEGAPQPKPGGGQACYSFIMPANNQRQVPTFVNTGDTIQVQNAKGLVSNSHTALWHDEAGNWIAAGINTGLTETNGANPVPASPTSSLIINFGAGWLPLGTGTITVPGGVSNASPLIQVNDNAIGGISGEFQFDVCVTNNAAATWSHIFDFTSSPHMEAWSISSVPGATPPNAGQWIVGTGYVSTFYTDGGFAWRQVEIESTIHVSNLTGLIVEFDYTAGDQSAIGGGNDPMVVLADATVLIDIVAPSEPVSPEGWSGSVAVTSKLVISLLTGVKAGGADPGGTATIKKLTLSGTGVNPYL